MASLHEREEVDDCVNKLSYMHRKYFVKMAKIWSIWTKYGI